MKRNLLGLITHLGLLALLISCSQSKSQRDPIIITAYASEAILSLDDLIKLADLIVIGDFDKANPSRWSTPDGKLPDIATIDLVSRERLSIFTDWDFSVVEFIKGEATSPIISVRTFGGQIGEDRMIVSDTPSYELGKTYLLFLFLETGPTSDVAPGAYYGTSSPYEINNGKAVSKGDEWLLEDLIAYIEKSLSETVSPTETPASLDLLTDTPFPPAEIFTETPLAAETPISTPAP